METILRRWWTEKYKLPWTHECAQNATIEDLLVEYHEDLYDKDPSEARKAWADGGEFYFEHTGDPLLDKWEEELAKGLIPDLEEGMSQEQRAQLQKEREAARRKKGIPEPEFIGGMSDAEKRKYASQYAAPGSRREQELLQRRARSSMLGSAPDPGAWEDLLAGLK
jgi:hypothetical protein